MMTSDVQITLILQGEERDVSVSERTYDDSPESVKEALDRLVRRAMLGYFGEARRSRE